MIGTLQIRISRLQVQPKNFNMRLSVIGDSNLGHVKHIESLQHDRLDLSQRTVTFGTDTAAYKAVVLTNHLAARGHLVHRDSLFGRAYSTAGGDKVYYQGGEGSFAP